MGGASLKVGCFLPPLPPHIPVPLLYSFQAFIYCARSLVFSPSSLTSSNLRRWRRTPKSLLLLGCEAPVEVLNPIRNNFWLKDFGIYACHLELIHCMNKNLTLVPAMAVASRITLSDISMRFHFVPFCLGQFWACGRHFSWEFLADGIGRLWSMSFSVRNQMWIMSYFSWQNIWHIRNY